MKKVLFLALLGLSAPLYSIAQFADPFVNITLDPASVPQNSNGIINVALGNLGNSDIQANSIVVTLVASTNSEILGINTTMSNDNRWTVQSSTTGTQNTYVLRNTAILPALDPGTINFNIKGTVVSPGAIVSSTAAYVPGGNPLIPGNAESSVQGNGETDNDNSTTSLIVTPSTPLAIKLVSFAGTPSGCGALLNWQTADEKGMEAFEVESSLDGRVFTRIATINASGKDGAHSYSLRQAQNTGKAWYRLLMKQADGKSSYSNIISVTTGCGSQLAYKVYPVPAANLLSVAGTVSGDNINLIDMSGKVVLQATAGDGTSRVDVSRLPAGTYTLVVNDADASAITLSIQR